MKWICSYVFFAGISVFAQSGDKEGEVQAPPPATMKIPASPALSVEEALRSFKLQPGFRIEVVASEPQIETPVEIEFDPAGHMYVLEMRAFMPNVEGKGEDQPIGRVTRLSDRDADGRMETQTVFADNLLMPRAIAHVRGGLLIAEPPNLWFFKDTDGDGRADLKDLVSSDYGNQANPEHTANGLMWGMDNWIYSANHTVRYRIAAGSWDKENTIFRGQWGITQDDFGRLFYNSNSDQLRGDLVPVEYFSRNDNFKSPFGANVQIARDQSTYPIRVNPGVNRGYQQGTLKADGTLAKFTGACGPVIYRGDLFPEKFRGAAFLCEPTANFVRCNLLTELDGVITGTNAFPNEEFMASTDERFRPVNLFNGPDGALYVVDMYRGVIQHRIYLTTYLRNQALDRKLETPVNMGRIYRIVPENFKRVPVKNLAALPTSMLVSELSSAKGWIRDAAQRLLVERRDFVTLPLLERMAGSGVYPAAMHALWTLHGLNALSSEPVVGAMKSEHPKVRATAVRVADRLINSDDTLAQEVIGLVKDESLDVRLQVMFTLGELRSESSERVMFDLLSRNVENRLMRDAAISGLKGRELSFLARVLAEPSWNDKTAGREETVKNLAASTTGRRDAKQTGDLLEVAARAEERWTQYAILDGVATLIPPKGKAKEPPKPKPLMLASEPAALAKLAALSDEGITKRLATLEPLLAWKGKPGMEQTQVAALTAEEQALFDAGKAQYPLICGACHQPTGLGQDGLAPPLVDSDWVTGSPERVTRIVLGGLRGPINVKGKVWELEMPPVWVLSDKEIASLLTYIRREWGHQASAITPEFVAKVRKETESREEAWTEADLLKIP